MNQLFLPFLASIGVMRLITTAAAPTTPSSPLENGLSILASVLTIIAAVIGQAFITRYNRRQKKVEEAVQNAPKQETINTIKSDQANLFNKHSQLESLVKNLNDDLTETRQERDKFKDSWGKELTEHSMTKLRLNEAVETNIELAKVNMEKHKVNEELETRLDALEKKVSAYQPIEALTQSILAGMTAAVTVGITAALANMPRVATGEHTAAPSAEKIGQN